MKSITTVICLLIAGVTFSQHSIGGVSTHSSNVSVNTHSTQSSTNVHYSTPNVSVNTNHYNSNYNNNSNTNNNNNSNSNNNWNTNSSWSNNNYNSNNYNNNSNNNNSNRNNSYNGGYNNGYNSYNNSNYNSYQTFDEKQSYTARDENYGAKTVSEDQGKMSAKSNPFNINNMKSNYRNNTAIEKFFKQNQKPSQIFIINAQQENTVKGTGGTVVKIAPNSFVDKNGEVVKGDVEFEMKEMYSKSDMILSNAHTVCNDQVLKSGGEVFIGASRNGEPLILAHDKPMSVGFPTISKEPMQLFNGEPNNSSVNWNLSSPTEVTPIADPNSSTGYSYNFTSSNMNWLNCDAFTNRRSNSFGPLNPTTKVNVRLPNRYDSTNTAVFLVYKGQNSVTKFDGFSTYDGTTRMKSDQNAFDTKWYSVDQGSDVTIVAISEINGQYYSSMQSTIIQKDHTADLIMNPTTLDQFKTDMENIK
jgi:hypothetical protein